MQYITELQERWFENKSEPSIFTLQEGHVFTVTSLVGSFRFTRDMKDDVTDYLDKLADHVRRSGE